MKLIQLKRGPFLIKVEKKCHIKIIVYGLNECMFFAIMVMFTYTSYRLYHSISKALSHMFFVLYALLIRSVSLTVFFYFAFFSL